MKNLGFAFACIFCAVTLLFFSVRSVMRYNDAYNAFYQGDLGQRWPSEIIAQDAVAKTQKDNAKKVKVALVMDFRCHTCKTAYQSVMKVLPDYPQIDFYLHYIPFMDEQSMDGASAALAAGMQNPVQYWLFSDFLMKDNFEVNEENLKNIAITQKLDVDKFLSDYKKNAKIGRSLLTTMDAMKILSIKTIPSFIIGHSVYSPDEDVITPDMVKSVFDHALQ
jgi:protein-disulfide isomerase